MDTLARLLDIEQRLKYIESLPWLRCEGVHNSTYPVDNQAIANGASYTTASLWNSYGLPPMARGIVGSVRGDAANAAGYLMFDSADDVPDLFSCVVGCWTQGQAGYCTGHVWVRIGVTGATAGMITVKAGGANFTGVYLSIVGYWL